ncbi:uncharacterized protein LOC134193921 [Corticium candelabrum]|uniref:uncharacterized protein LOC134193921 n=1 Tax=Corticium candelabrum TaxID=121492 RepID=UPI002E273C43|nr:uncharacterized protein LOC134193921 [Corticium candelabrum]
MVKSNNKDDETITSLLKSHQKAMAQMQSTLTAKEDTIKHLTTELETTREMLRAQSTVSKQKYNTSQDGPQLQEKDTASNKHTNHLLLELNQAHNDNILLKEELSIKDSELKRMEKLISDILNDHEGSSDSDSDSEDNKSKESGFQFKMKLRDSMLSKEASHKMKLMYEIEIRRLQDHVEKVKQRCDADIRRQQREHTQSLSIMQKEAALVLRAVNRFKEGVSGLLERECRLPNIITFPATIISFCSNLGWISQYATTCTSST